MHVLMHMHEVEQASCSGVGLQARKPRCPGILMLQVSAEAVVMQSKLVVLVWVSGAVRPVGCSTTANSNDHQDM